MTKLRLSIVGTSLAVILALFWAIVGLGKIAPVVFPDLQTKGVEAVWIGQFPNALVVAASSTELLVSLCLFAGLRRIGLIGGLMLLAVFSGVLVVFPVPEGQSCGRAGSIVGASGAESIDPIIRNGFLSSLHILGLVLVWPDIRKHLGTSCADQT